MGTLHKRFGDAEFSSVMKVGFIGLGLQGAPMADQIRRAGFDLTVWARRPEVLDRHARHGVAVAGTVHELGAACDVVGLCVTGDADVIDLVENGLLYSMRPGSTVIVHSTVAPQTCQRLGEVAASAGIDVLDAPVSGGPDAAQAGRLSVMVGGHSNAYRRSLPIMDTYGDPVIYLGALGNGLRAKIINNLAFIANMAVSERALRIGQSLGIAQKDLENVLRQGSARSMALEVLDRTFTGHAAHAAALFEKDLGLAESLTRNGDVECEDLLGLGQRLCERLRG